MNRDPQIRAALHASLSQRLAPGAVVIDEFGMGSCIADLAVFTPHALHVFEIKSDADTLRRLDRQAEVYGRACSTATLVAGPRLLASAASVVPAWWGVLVAADAFVPREGVHRICFDIVRQPRPNPRQDRKQVAQLLWASEARAELRARGLWKGMSRKGGVAWKHALAESLTLEELRELIHGRVAGREWLGSRKPPRVIGEMAEAA
jgi:hypothetical protein